ncbi:hypothetical protein HDU97_008327 [Phlyctochytrium planicorne]|nr:hypothetical protein HDU97_008327 [Phlyctochytrium planicorne]
MAHNTLIVFLLTILTLSLLTRSTTAQTVNPECGIRCASPPENAPKVCGSNGKTYDSECLLKLGRCEDQTLVKAYDGECKGSISAVTLTATTTSSSSAAGMGSVTAVPSATSSVIANPAGQKGNGSVRRVLESVVVGMVVVVLVGAFAMML